MAIINKSEHSNINRGVELILRKKGGDKKTESNSKEFGFKKVFSFLRKEIYFEIKFKVINKK